MKRISSRISVATATTVLIILIMCSFIFEINCQVFMKAASPSTSSHKNKHVKKSAEPVNSTIINGFEDGIYYSITNIATEKFMSVEGANFSRGANVVAKDWDGDENQQWLALLAPMSKSARDVNSNTNSRFILIPKRQAYSSKRKDESSNEVKISSPKYTLQTLPQLTEVLTLDSLTGNLTTEIYQRGSSSQQWIAENAGQGRIFIRNLGNNQCIKNFEYIYRNLYSVLFESSEPKPLSTLDCSTTDISQKWFLERI